MGIKGSDTSFYVGSNDESQPFRSELYTFVHPNCDAVFDHLSIFVVQANDKLLVTYGFTNGSAKAQRTYDYFRLKEIEINSFDEAQGLASATPDIGLPPDTARLLRDALRLEEGN
jgi:hypothetical protein